MYLFWISPIMSPTFQRIFGPSGHNSAVIFVAMLHQHEDSLPAVIASSTIVRFRLRIETKCFCTLDIGQPLLMERAE
jgi:hypothetical protein